MAHTHKQTEIYHTANGSTTSFSYPFEYYQKSDVHVTVNGTAKTQGTHYDVTGTNVVFKTSPSDYTPANNDVIRVYRDTDVNTSKATFAAGSSIRATDLNNNETQLLFSVQEAVDQEIVTADIRDAQITSAKIKDGAVTADQIGANALTYAKIQNVSATNRVLGRDSAGAGIIEEISPVDLRTMLNVEDGSTGDQTNAEIRTAVEAASNSNVFTDADHSKLDGIAAGAEVNVQSDWQATSGDSEILNKPTIPELIDEDNFSSNSATKAPSQQSVKAYITSTSQPLDSELTELSTMDSGTASSLADLTSTEVQILDGATVSTSELNILDGVTATAAELNYVDGVTSNVQTQLDAKQPLDADLTTLAGMQSGTASILASSTALTSTTDELNLLDGKSIVTSVSGSSTDVQLPTAKAVNDQIVSTLQDVGGFFPIDDELKFPNTNPDPNDDAGTIVSIADAGGIVVNGSGVSTTGRTLGGSTVTINGIDSSLHSTTIAAGKGMLVQTTSTLNTYDYHRLVVDEAGVASAQTLVNDFNDRYQVAASAPSNHPDGSALTDGDLWFDTSANVMKVYDLGNTSYAAVTSVGDYKLLTLEDTDGSAADFANQSFNLKDGGSAANVTSAGQLIVSVNGVIQKPNAGTTITGSDEGFCLVDSDTIKFATAPGSGASVFVTLIGSATSVNVPATNSIVEAAIQTNVVSEEKLKISNAGSNGQFLSKQSGDSGGLTWADVPAGVGGATGVDFNDDVEARWGTGNDLVIEHQNTNDVSVINANHAGGSFLIKKNDIEAITVGTNGIGIGNPSATDNSLNIQGSGGRIFFGVSSGNNPTMTQNATHGVVFGDHLGAQAFAFSGSEVKSKHIRAWTDSTYDLGTDAVRFQNAYVDTYYGDGSNLTGISAGATGGNSGANGVFWENAQNVTHDYTITNGKNAGSFGPITIDSGATVTIGDGEYWTIV